MKSKCNPFPKSVTLVSDGHARLGKLCVGDYWTIQNTTLIRYINDRPDYVGICLLTFHLSCHGGAEKCIFTDLRKLR